MRPPYPSCVLDSDARPVHIAALGRHGIPAATWRVSSEKHIAVCLTCQNDVEAGLRSASMYARPAKHLAEVA